MQQQQLHMEQEQSLLMQIRDKEKTGKITIVRIKKEVK